MITTQEEIIIEVIYNNKERNSFRRIIEYTGWNNRDVALANLFLNLAEDSVIKKIKKVVHVFIIKSDPISIKKDG